MQASAIRSHGILNCVYHPYNIITTSCSPLISRIKETFVGTAAYSLKNLFSPSELAKQLKKVSEGHQKLTEKLIVQAFNADEFPQLRSNLATIFKKMNDKSIDKALKAVFADQASKNPELLIKRLNSLLTLEKMEQAIKSQYSSFKGTVDAAVKVAGPANRELGTQVEESRRHTIRLAKHYAFGALEWIMDTLMYVFMLRRVTDGDATRTEKQMIATMQWQAFRENIALISAWMIALTVFTSSVLTAAAIFTGITLTMLVLGGLYLKYLKPPPAYLHPAANLTELAIKGELPTTMFREKQVEEILTLWHTHATTRNIRLYPLLVGDSGVGKTLIFNEVAQRIADGKVDPALKALHTYSVNTSDLVDGNGSPEHWELIVNNLKEEGYEKKSGLFLDEIQGAFQKEREVLGNMLLTAMDANGMPFMVFACTKRDYDNYLSKHPAFLRRVKVIDVNSLTEEQTYAILAKEIKQDAADIFISPKVLKKVAHLADLASYADVFKNCPQPITSKRILYTAIAEVRLKKFDTMKKQLLQAQADRRLIDLEWDSVNNPPPDSPEANIAFTESGLQKLDKEIAQLSHDLEVANHKLIDFKVLQNKFSDVILKFKHLAMDIKKDVDKGKQSEDKLKEFTLLLHYLKPALESTIEGQKTDALGIYPEITEKAIDDYIQKEALSLRQKQGLIEESVL